MKVRIKIEFEGPQTERGYPNYLDAYCQTIELKPGQEVVLIGDIADVVNEAARIAQIPEVK